MRRTVSNSESGFTLVELMMAAFVLVVGILGVVALVDRANGALGESNARVGATNLARELVESTRSLDYDDVTTGRLPALLHAKTGVPGQENPWKVVRRGVEYTVKTRVCLFDDPADGLAATSFTTGDADRPLCTRPGALNSRTDDNPDDFRRLQVDIDWGYRSKPQHITQDALIVNPSGGLGPRIIDFPEPTSQFTTSNTSGGQLVLSGITSTPARSIHWSVNDAAAGGDADPVVAGPAPTAWKIGWNIGTNATSPYVYDGSYTVNAQAFSDLGTPGDLRAVSVQLNRYPPLTPSDVLAGRNTSRTPSFVDLRWSPNPERDIIGYRVYRVELNLSRTRICPGSGGDAVLEATSCIDDNPPIGPVVYEVVAVDRTDLMNPSSATRQSTAATVTVPVAGVQPTAPSAPQASTVDGLPRLTWTPPGDATGIAFYRIYRDGTAIGDRYAATVTNEPYWIDSSPGTGSNPSHTYRVSAVSTALNESALSPPVNWP